MAIVGLCMSPMKTLAQDVRQPIEFETSYIDPTLGMENQLPRTPHCRTYGLFRWHIPVLCHSMRWLYIIYNRR